MKVFSSGICSELQKTFRTGNSRNSSLMLFILFTRGYVLSVSIWSRVYTTLLSVSRMAEFRCDAHKHTHTDTCAHTQVSTLPPADRIGLKNQCPATDTFTPSKT